MAIIAGGIAVPLSLAPDDLSIWLRVPIFVGGAVGGFLLVVLCLVAWFTAKAPYEQRKEARAELTRHREAHDLLELDRQLRAIREANSRNLGKVKERGLTGPLGVDEDPWVRGQNENLGLWLESNGFPDLVSELVVPEPNLATWEDVRKTAREIDTNLTRVIDGERLADVRNLRESVKAEMTAQASLPSERLSVLYEEGAALRTETRQGGDEAFVDRLATRSHEVKKWSREVEGVIQNVAPESFEEWNKKRREWSDDPTGSNLLEGRLELLDGIIARLRAKEGRA